jgi:hypothetical protein
MKCRHATFIAGTLAAAYAGHVHAIEIAGLATPPDTTGAAWPIFYRTTGLAYGHGGLQLTNGAGQRDVIDYTAWTEAGGVYTFTVDATLAYTYDMGDVAGPLNSACLRRADGLMPIMPYHRLEGIYGLNTRTPLRIADYADGFFGAVCGDCGDFTGYSYPRFDGQLPYLPNTVDYYDAYPRWWGSGGGMCGNIYLAGAYLYHHHWSATAETRWQFNVSCWGWGATYKLLWNGYKACAGGDPRGTYLKDSGCGVPTALVLEAVP